MSVAVTLPSDANDAALPPAVLLPYQQRWIADDAQLKVAEKSRRIGLTWAEASDDVLIAAAQGGTNVFYIGPTADMALEYIEACAMWARAYNMAATQVEEGLWEDDGDKAIKTYKIDFPGSGRRIVALSSRPTNLRGKQGVIVIDEAAFHNDLNALLKAAMAMLIWGAKVRIISTHDGIDNQFNELIQEVRMGKRGKATVHRITFDEAVADGLYRRVCYRRGIEWNAADEAKWKADVRTFYGDDAAEELDVIPSQGGGAYFNIALIESCMSAETPLVRRKFSAEFNAMPEPVRAAEVDAWCNEELLQHLSVMNPRLWYCFGEDFGRVSDGTSIMLGEEGKDLITRVKLMVEIWNCPFSQQEQILFFIVKALKLFRGGALDATGNGAALAEAAADEFGATRIEQVKLTESFYMENFPTLKGAMEDRTFRDIPKDVDIRNDFRAVRLINGVPKLPNAKTKKASGEKDRSTRHGEAAVTAMMLHYAMKRDVVDLSGVRTSGVLRESANINDFWGDFQ